MDLQKKRSTNTVKRHSPDYSRSLVLFQRIHTEFDFSMGETESRIFQLRKWTFEFNIHMHGPAFSFFRYELALPFSTSLTRNNMEHECII